MTVAQAIQIIRDRIHRDYPSADTSTLPAYVQANFGMAVNTVLGELLRSGGYQFPGGMLKPYVVDVKWDEQRRRHYFDMPIGVPLFNGDAAVAGIHAVGDESFEWIPLLQGQESRSPSLEFYGRPFWRQEAQRVYAQYVDSVTKQAVAKLLPYVGDIEPDDNIPMPAEGEGRVMELVAQWFIGKKQLPQDQTADNNDQK